MENQRDNIDNINEIAEQIFNDEPKSPNSIQLQLEERTADFAEQDGFENFLFNILYLITFRGMQILYGHKNVLFLTEKQYEKINDYVKSYGYTLHVNANNTDENMWEFVKRGGKIQNYQILFEKYKY